MSRAIAVPAAALHEVLAELDKVLAGIDEIETIVDLALAEKMGWTEALTSIKTIIGDK